MLIRLVYASTAAQPVTSEFLEDILKTARLRNEVRDLTGLLVFDHQYFLQVIEGQRAMVSLLLGKLFADSRHRELTVLEFDEIAQRSFADWSMSFIPAATANRALLLRHGVSSHFNPYGFAKTGALAFLTAMRGSAAGGV
jgi:hypothetical protein